MCLSGKESDYNVGDTGDAGGVGLVPGWERSPREGNGNPLQYSCLGNPKDRGTRLATVHGVVRSRTWLSTDTHTQWKCGYMSRNRGLIGLWGKTNVEVNLGRGGLLFLKAWPRRSSWRNWHLSVEGREPVHEDVLGKSSLNGEKEYKTLRCFHELKLYDI